MSNARLTFGSLFSGIGGLDLGFTRAGMRCVWQVEIDSFCRRVLARRFPHSERLTDAKEVGSRNLAAVDVVVGGDPCQTNSIAGRSREPSLAAEFLRVVGEMRPAIVVRENPAVVRKDAPWPWYRFRSELEKIGYVVLSFRLRACCFGADHRRDRLFLLAALPNASAIRRHEGGGQEESARKRRNELACGSRPSDHTRMGGTVHGVSARVDRLRGLGTAVHPAVSEFLARVIVEAHGCAS